MSNNKQFKMLFMMLKDKSLRIKKDTPDYNGLFLDEETVDEIQLFTEKIFSNKETPAKTLIKSDSELDLKKTKTRLMVGANLASIIRNEKHDEILTGIDEVLGYSKYYKTMSELEEDYNIDEFKNMKNRCETGKGNKEENELIKISRENYILFAQKKDKYQKDENGDFVEDDYGNKILIEKGDKVAVGVAFPTMQILNFTGAVLGTSNSMITEKFLIGTEIINNIWGANSIDFLDNESNSASYNLSQLLNYMELQQISDLHIKLRDEFSYVFTGRKHTKIVNLGEGTYSAKKTKDLIHQIKMESNRDGNDMQTEVRSLLVKVLQDGTTRNFRYHSTKATYNNAIGESVSIRRLARESELKSLKEINYLYLAEQMIYSVMKKNTNGLIIVSGATNSGKTTFLNALLIYIRDKLNRRIHRIENPAEVALKDVITFDLMQFKDAVNPLTLKAALKNVLSQDPDVTLVGEARDNEELEAAFELARMGHLALVTVHSSSNETAVDRFVACDKIDRIEFNDKLRMAINQHLTLKVCRHCEEWEDKLKFQCPSCGGSGATGVLPVYDLIVYFNTDKNDDLSDTKKLEDEGKAFRITKKDVLEYYMDLGYINNVEDSAVFDTDIDDYMGIEVSKLKTRKTYKDLMIKKD